MSNKMSKSQILHCIILIFNIIFSLVLFVYTISIGYTSQMNNIIAVVTVVQSVYLCYVYRYNIGLFIVMLMIAYTNYSVCMGVYLYPEIRPESLYSQFYKESTYGKTIICTFIFCFVLICLSKRVADNPKCIDSKVNSFNNDTNCNYIIAYGAVAVYLLIFFLTYNFGENGSRGSASALTEYRNIVMILGCLYGGKNDRLKVIWAIVIVVTSLMIFYSGNRVGSFASIILLVIMYYSHLVTYKLVLIIMPIAVILLALIGFMRGQFSLSVEGFIFSAKELSDSKLAFEGAIYGYLPSLATIELYDMISIEDKVKLFFQHIIYIFTIGSADNSMELVMFSRNYYVHYWGYISPTYFYFWFHYSGCIVLSVFIQYFIKLCLGIYKATKYNYLLKLKKTFSLFFIVNVTRWYCYGPLALFRGMFVCFILFNIVYFVDKLTRGKVKV